MLGGIFKAIRKVFRREERPLPTKPMLPSLNNPSETSTVGAFQKDNMHAPYLGVQLVHGESPTLDAIVAPEHVSDLDSELVDIAIMNQLKTHNMNLSKISINAIGFTPAVLGSLKSHNILTVEQLINYPKIDLLNLPYIGIFRLAQIQEGLNSFLNSLLTDAKEKPATQLSFGSIEQQERIIEEDPIKQLAELTERLGDIFRQQIPSIRLLLPPHVWKHLVDVVGKEPESFDDLEQSVQALRKDLRYSIEGEETGNYLTLKRNVQWFKRAIEFGCLDGEIKYVLNSLDDRECLILTSRYKIERPLTLESLGEQLGITRERVRQIQQKVQKKLVARIKRSTLLYSNAALYILRTQKDNATLDTWTKQLVNFGFLKNVQSLELLIAIARATSSSELALPEEFTQSLETHVSQHLLTAAKPVLEKARKICRNCGVVRALSLVNEKTTEEDVEQILRLNGYKEVAPGWWARDTGECVLERVAVKVITHCGPVSPSTMRYALRRHLSRFQLPAPPSELLTKLLQQKGNFIFGNGLIQLTNSPAMKSSLTGPEEVFLNMSQSDGPILSFESIHHKLLEAGFSPGSVTSLLRYSAIVQRVATALYSLVGAKFDEMDIQEAQSQLTRIPANSTLRMRSDGVIEFETNAGTWLEYGGVLASGPAASLKGDWKLNSNGTEAVQLVVDGNFIRGLSKVSKNLDVMPGERIRIEFNTWTREAKMVKVVRNE